MQISTRFLLVIAIGATLFLGGFASVAQAADSVSGIWGTKYGDMRLVQKGDQVEGTLINTSNFCPFKNSEKIFSGMVLEDSITGSFKMCQADDDCGPPVWAVSLLLIAKEGSVLTGTANSKEAMCPLVGFSKSEGGERGLYFKKLRNLPKPKAKPKKKTVAKNNDTKDKAEPLPVAPAPVIPGPPAAPGTYDPRSAMKVTSAQTKLLLRGKSLLAAGQFEKAREQFKKVLKEDSGNPNALAGIGVSYYGRQDYKEALKYYKKALSEDPNYSMAYYNMACIYALQKKPDMALRYLKMSVLNGFEAASTIENDPDLSSLRQLPEYQQILKGDY